MASILVPPLGESIVEATVSRWLKKEGDAVAAGDTLVELETDKITVEVPALAAGVLSARAKQEGDVVGVGEVLGEIAAGAGAPAVPAAAPAPPSTPSAPVAAPVAAPAAAAAPASEVKAAPSAVRMAAETGANLSQIAGTGRGGVVSKADVIAAAAAPSVPALREPALASGVRETREKMTTRRKRIADNLLHSQLNTAHLTTFNEIDMSAISSLRDRMREKVEKQHGLRLSFMPFFAKAASIALEAFPVVNAKIDNDHIIYHHYVNLGIAVASEAGLVVPNLKDAHTRSVVELGQDIAAVAKKARDGKLAMDDLTGGTFTITNGGVFGSLVSTPIINYPQVGILGLHKIQDRPVVVNGEIVIRPMMYVALSYDHRIIDGQQAVLFLIRIKELMEDPAAMLLG